jgi:single-stranded-DNA-specific exonuclease
VRAIRGGETILVHGDYDVDGISSTTLLTRAFRALGGTVVPFIPRRLLDGYDLTDAGVRAAREAGATVVVTCDCGTSAIAPVRALQADGIDVIISDHHLPGGDLPNAYAILNPKRPGCGSEDKDLAAVGVAFKLALAVTRALGGNENVVYGCSISWRSRPSPISRHSVARIACSPATGSRCSPRRRTSGCAR